ncbi:hypothetical protein BC834DRAFT_300418 [Gloeopeniophorella convolvens]|nr:hypothetical protein BC834DRAFT_300418 [Gloeopeniophorella convolvens]
MSTYITEDRHPILVETKLDYDNFSIWCFRNEYALQARNLWGLVNGTETPPRTTTRLQTLGTPRRARAVPTRGQHPRQVALDRTAHGVGARDLAQAPRGAAVRVHAEAVARHEPLPRRAPARGRRRVGARAAHGQPVGGRGVLQGVHERQPDDFFAHTLLRSLPPSWSDFVSTWRVATVASDAPTPPPAVLMGHILDTDAWHRGRTESRIRRNKARRQKSSKDTVFR